MELKALPVADTVLLEAQGQLLEVATARRQLFT